MNFSTILALLAVSTFTASHGVLASSGRAAPVSSTIITTATTTTLLATTLTTKTAKEPSSPDHDAAMQTQPSDVLGAEAPTMNPSTASTDAVTTITSSATGKKCNKK